MLCAAVLACVACSPPQREGPDTCTDGKVDGDEADVDCGGSCAKKCADGQFCAAASDCAGGNCDESRCAPPCVPEDDASLCGRLGRNCGAAQGADSCGTVRQVECGGCNPPESCGGGPTPGTCGCTAESDTRFCSRLGKNCGRVAGTDDCGRSRTVASCGTCQTGKTCSSSNVCTTCSSESDATLCQRVGRACGPYSGTDNCGRSRSVECGTCQVGKLCSSAGNCVACSGETDAQMCSRLNKQCGSYGGTDNCGRTRTAQCGGCPAAQTCGGDAYSTPNRCGCTPETNAAFCTRTSHTCGSVQAADNCGTQRSVDCGTCPVASVVVAPEPSGGTDGYVFWDAQGEPHAMYRDLADAWLRHAWRSGGAWQREVVDADVDVRTQRFGPPSAVVDGAGTVYAYYPRYGGSGGTNEFRFAVRTGGTWQRGRPSPGQIADLGILADGTPIAALSTGTSGHGPWNVVLKRFSGGAWTETVVASQGSYYSSWSSGPLIAVDAQDRPWVAFRTSGANVSVAQPASTGWAVSETPIADEIGSFLLDASGTAYLRPRYGNSFYFGSGAFWTQETATGRTFVLDSHRRVTALGLDVGGNYGSNYKTFAVWAKRRDGTAWTETVRATFTPISDVYRSDSWEPWIGGLDPSDRPVLFQQPASTYKGLELVQFPAAGGQTRQNVDLRPDVNPPPSVSVGTDGRARVAYVSTDGAPGPYTLFIATEQNGSGWSRRAVSLPTGVSSPSTPMLHVDAAGRDHLAFFAAEANTTRVFHAESDGSGNWTAASTGQSGGSALRTAFDSQGALHFAYCDYPGNIYYAGPSGASWSGTQVVADPDPYDSGCNLGGLTVDPQGNPYVSYIAGSYGENIKLARRQGGVWQSAQLSYDGNFYGHAMALDASGRPCVAHTPLADDGGGYVLTLSCLDGGVFVAEPLVQKPYKVKGLARDTAGGLHVFVSLEGWGSNPTNLVHVRRGASGWVEEDVGDIVPDAFAATAAGRPRLVFFEESTGRVRFAAVP